MDNDATSEKVENAVKLVPGVSNVIASAAKCQVFVDMDDSAESAVNAAIESVGVTVIG